MKKMFNKNKGLVKGKSTSVMVSIGIHVALLIAAATWVVFDIVKKDEIVYEPPPPPVQKKMPIKKPTVKVKKQIRPEARQRIAVKNVQKMTDFQLPSGSGASDGLGSEVGGFEMVPDVAEMSIFGAKRSTSAGNDFVGTFYSLSLDRQGNRSSINGIDSYCATLRRFLESGWNPNSLAMFYRSPQKLYTTFFFIPMTASEFVPRSFGIPDEIYTLMWLAHYKGRFAAKESGEYRFWARAENAMAIRVNGKLVCLGGHSIDDRLVSDWESTAEENRKYYRGHGPMVVGDWFKLDAGVPADFEIIFGDNNGVWTQCTVTIQKKGERYNKNPDGAPILPVFKTDEIPSHLIDEIMYSLIQKAGDAVQLTKPVMFNTY